MNGRPIDSDRSGETEKLLAQLESLGLRGDFERLLGSLSGIRPEGPDQQSRRILEILREANKRIATLLAESPGGSCVLERAKQAGSILLQSLAGSYKHRVGELSPFGVPQELGDYVVKEKIGAGGMGEVFLAVQRSLNRPVALKILPPRLAQRPEALDRFLREAKAAGKLNHPAIVAVYECGIAEGFPYIAMQLIKGVDLNALLSENRPLSVERSLEIARDIAYALEAAHQAGIIHRDVKPANILLEGEAHEARRRGRAFLTDFGLALLRESEEITRTGEILGTPSFMAPEQARGERAQATSDVYSLGATLYAMLSGRPPHIGSSYAQILRNIESRDPPPLRSLNPKVDRDTAIICEKAMRWDSASRYSSAGEFAEDIERRLANKPIRARPAGPIYRVRLALKRNRRQVWTAAGVACVALALVAAATLTFKKLSLSQVEFLLAQGKPDEARAKLEAVRFLPGFAGKQWKLTSRLCEAEGDLGGAVQSASFLPQAEERLSELKEVVRRQLDLADQLSNAGYWGAAISLLWQATGGLKAFCSLTTPRNSFLIKESRRAGRLAVVLSAQAGLWNTAFALYEKVCASPPDPAVLLSTVREDLGGKIGLSGNNLALEAFFDRHAVMDQYAFASAIGGLRPGMRQSDWKARDIYFRTSFARMDPSLWPDLLSVCWFTKAYKQLLDKNQQDLLEARIWFLERFRCAGEPVEVPASPNLSAGDVDGDGVDEILFAGIKNLALFHADQSGLHPVGGALARLPALPKGASRFSGCLLHDIDGDGLAEVIVSVMQRDHPDEIFLQAFKFTEEGFEALPVRHGPYGARIPGHGLVAADIDGDGDGELVLTLTGGTGDVQREVHLLWHPFTPSCREVTLSGPEIRADCNIASLTDLNNNGKYEITVATGPWKGWDFRVWEYRGEGCFQGPFRISPFGALFALPFLNKEGGQDLFVVKTGAYLPNEAVFPEGAHHGPSEGIYLVHFPKDFPFTAQTLSFTRAKQAGLIYHFIPYDGAFDLQKDNLVAERLSNARWNGKNIFCVCWVLSQLNGARPFVEFAVGPFGGSPFCILRAAAASVSSKGSKIRLPSSIQAELVTWRCKEGEPKVGIFFFKKDESGTGKAQLCIAGKPEPSHVEARIFPLLIEGALRAHRYDFFAHLEEAWDTAGSLSPREVFPTLRALAEATTRSLDISGLRRVVSAARSRAPFLPDSLRTEIKSWQEELALYERLLRTKPISGGGVWRARFPPFKKKEWKGPAPPVPPLQIEVQRPSRFLFTYELVCDNVAFGTNTFIGIVPKGSKFVEKGIGSSVYQSGGTGRLRAQVCLHVRGAQIPRRPEWGFWQLKRGERYRVTLAMDKDYRIHQVFRDAETGSVLSILEYPPADQENAGLGDAPSGRLGPLAPGTYLWGIFDLDRQPSYDREEPQIVTVEAAELRILPEE